MSEMVRELGWRFRLLPSSYCHESWLPQGLSDEQLPLRQRSDGMCHRYLTPWLVQRLKLGPPDDIAFDDPLQRLALLDGDTLQRLAPALGLLACRDALRRTLDGAVLVRLRAAASLDEIGFIATGPDGMLPASLAAPEVDLADDDVAQQLAVRGRRLLFALAAADRQPVIRRLRLKFPRAPGLKAVPRAPVAAHERAALSSWLSAQFVPRIASPWTWLFS